MRLMNGVYKTKEEVLNRAKEAIGKTFGDLDVSRRLARGDNKGRLGLIVEEGWFHLKPNNRAEYDFPEAKVELKVTPFVRRQDGEISAKERLVCNIIDYMEEAEKHDFFDSSFWKKCESMLIMPYEHKDGEMRANFRIAAAFLHQFSYEDLKIIEQDWAWIIGKIQAGQAHELSEAETTYLSACTKGANRNNLRRQPYSSIPAMQRAYALKTTYMTRIIRQALGRRPSEGLVHDVNGLKGRFEEYVQDVIRPYVGWTQQALAAHFGLPAETWESKGVRARIVSAIFSIKKTLSKTEEFQKANICAKTVFVNKKGRMKEDISFPAFKISELLAEPSWEEAEFGEMLRTRKFFFVVFKENERGEVLLNRTFFWHMPREDLEEARRVWEKTRQTIRQGVRFWRQGNRLRNDLPNSTENPISHVRPHGQDRTDVDVLPDGRTITKQCFWLNKHYIERVIEESR